MTSPTPAVVPLRAFHNDPAVKEKYLARVRAHAAADRLVRGVGWEGKGANARGCAVGCTLEKYEHAAYEDELGVPRQLAYLEDNLFENLPKDVAMKWPERFLAAIPVGADLTNVFSAYLVWLLTDPTDGVLQLADEQGKIAIQAVADLYSRRIKGDEPTDEEWTKAGDLAAEAAEAAWAAEAARAARAARAAEAAWAAWAAEAARAAWAAEAAWAAWAAEAARAARAARAAWAAEYEKRAILQADKLIAMIEAAPVVAAGAK